MYNNSGNRPWGVIRLLVVAKAVVTNPDDDSGDVEDSSDESNGRCFY